MKKKKLLPLVLLLVSLSSWTKVDYPPIVEIECSIKPIDRSKIHPTGEYDSSQSASTNWSGYVASADLTGNNANDTVSYVAGSWVVPTLAATTDDTYCAIWVGIDGWMNGTVEQIGTSHNWSNGAQQNYAWFEMYPQGSYEISGFPVDNGDVVSGRVAYDGDNTFKLVITNFTKGVSTAIPTSYTMSSTALRSSAEWIVEAPFSGSILPLSDFQTVTLNYCSAVINGVHGLINNGAWMNDEITMEKTNGVVEAQPTVLLKEGSCFQVAWKSE